MGLHIFSVFQSVRQSFFIYVLLFFIFITGFTIFYNVLGKMSVSMDSNFLLQILFYIPCLITDFIQYLGNEYQTTPNVVFILFIIEIVLVIMYLYVPRWIESISKMDRIGILDKSVFLDKQLVVSNSDLFVVRRPGRTTTSLGQSSDKTLMNMTYSITFWVYISSPDKQSETEIFNYASHPRITYLNNTDNTKLEQNKFIVYFSNTGDDQSSKYSFTAPQQKWNFICINYGANSICDLFLNGELIKSMDIGNSIPTYSVSDNISVGSDGGIYGAISNISYYRHPLSLSEIRTLYNLLVLKETPVFSG
jgi:hypothetical protein